MATMGALAGRTRRLRFGMNVVSLALRDPVLLAKQCATIDVLSEGRLLPAFGIGSPLGPEWQALALDTRSRGKRMDECLEIVSRLWREDSVDFDGVHFRLKGASIAPKPGQAGLDGLDDIARVIRAIKDAAAAAGRTIEEDHYGAGLAFHFGRAADPAVVEAKAQVVRRVGRDVPSYFAIGDAEAILARI